MARRTRPGDSYPSAMFNAQLAKKSFANAKKWLREGQCTTALAAFNEGHGSLSFSMGLLAADGYAPVDVEGLPQIRARMRERNEIDKRFLRTCSVQPMKKRKS